jgi:outer membrane protein assembly factor BamB
MKTLAVYSLVLLLTLISMHANGDATETDSRDVLKNAILMNSATYPSPITSYRKGHVSKHPTRHYAKIHKTGYTIDLPGAYPIATPAVYKDKLYISGGFGSKQFHCFDVRTGKTIWTINLDDDGPSSCVIEDDVVVFNTESCTLFACRADTGEMIWSWWLGDPLTSSPAISNGRVFTTYPANGQRHTSGTAKKRHADASHVMGCFDLYSGKILWQKWIDGDAISAPVIVDHTVYITTFSGTVYAFNTMDGTIDSAVKARATSAPTVVKDQIYFTKRTDKHSNDVKESIATGRKSAPHLAGTYHEKRADYLDQKVQRESDFSQKSKSLDAGNGFAAAPAASGYEKAYSNVGQGSVSSMQSFQGSRILNYQGKNYNTMGDELICTRPRSGKTVWKKKFKGNIRKSGGFLATPPVAVHNRIIVATLNGDVELYEAATGKLEKRYRLNTEIRYQPIVHGGRIFVGTQNGKVICIDTQNRKLTGWPMWGRDAAHTGIIH